MDTAEKRLHDLGYELPDAPAPAANYLPWRIEGNQLFLSGVLPLVDGQLSHTGAAGEDQTVDAAYEAARNCSINALASIKAALGSLDRVQQILLLTGFVYGKPGFPDSSQVINGASDFLVDILGEAGQHARAAVTVAGLPRNATVELQLIVAFKQD